MQVGRGNVSRRQPDFANVSTLNANHRITALGMAEAIGLVSGILALVEFGCKVISGTSSVLESRHGTAPDIHELDLILQAIQESHKPYREYVLSLSRKRLLPEHKNTLAMLQECEEIHGELSKVISTLQVSDKAFSRTLASWRVVIRRMRKNEQIGNLRVRLLELDRYVSKRIEQEMQEYVQHERRGLPKIILPC